MHGEWFSVIALGLASGFVLRSTALVADPEQEAVTLQALRDALYLARIEPKEAYMSMHIDPAQWCRIMSGQARQPGITQLINLPSRFWPVYLPLLARAVATEHLIQIAEDLLFAAHREQSTHEQMERKSA